MPKWLILEFSKLQAIEQKIATHITTMEKGTPSYLDPK
jgi:hypothetical protein